MENNQKDLDMLDVITNSYERLTRSERKVANFIYEKRTEPLYMSISNLSESCQVADATITRFCKTLGFSGFSEFKLALAKSLAATSANNKYDMYGEISPSDSISDLMKKIYNDSMDAISRTMEGLDEATVEKTVNMLLAADNVYCMGQGGSAAVAMDAYSRFLAVSPRFHWVVDSHLQSMTTSLLTKDDLLLYFSYSGSTKDILDVFKAAKEIGVKTVLITRFEKSPASSWADQILLSLANEGPLQAGSIAVKHSLLFIVDVLFNEYCRRNEEESNSKRAITAKSVVGKHL